MTVSKWIFIAALAYLLLAFIRFAVGVLPSKWRTNPAPPLGKKWPAVAYSFTGAMSPTKKESAYLHLPTYTAGMIFHIGLFTAVLNIFILLFGIKLPDTIRYVFAALFTLGALCGIAILIKRFLKPVLKAISNPDDFISNTLVTVFQIISCLAVFDIRFINVLFIYSAVLLLYIPVGKLRHSFYFFSSRIALGFFYGSRGVWSTKPRVK
ncbi:MAG: hypothetical protein QNK33_08485 [Bacteroidales bacterium]|nr:hypothetical protein [Bacteroidales bacterium]